MASDTNIEGKRPPALLLGCLCLRQTCTTQHYIITRSYLPLITIGGSGKQMGQESDWATYQLVFLAKFCARTNWLEVPPIQIYYVKYLG